ncbi:META domain-containing protein, partial [Staphylococcus aureus]
MIFSHRAGLAAIGLLALVSASAPTAAAAPAPQRAGTTGLAAHHWELEAWSGRKLPEGKPLRLDFDAGRFSADTGCNRAGGAYRVKGRTIRLGDGKGGFASTL